MPFRRLSFLLVFIALVSALPAQAQETWSLKPLEDWADAEWGRVMDGPSKLPSAVMKALLKHQEKVVLGMAEDDFDRFVDEEKTHLRAMGEEGLAKRIGTILADSGRFAAHEIPKMAKAFAHELANLPEEVYIAMVRAAAKELLLDHLDRLKATRLKLGEEIVSLVGPAPKRFEVRDTEGEFGSVSSSIPIPTIKVAAIHDSFVETAFEKVWSHKYGNLRLEAAKFEGLYDGKAGSFKYKDDYGREHRGFGVTFNAKSKFTAFRTDGDTKPLTIGGEDLYIRSNLTATLIDIASEAEFKATTIITEHGLLSHNKVTAGAGVKASARLPIEIELYVVKVRVTPYVEAHAGASAEAHANIELDWEGRIRFDIGASLSLGTGVGAGIIVEIEAGEFLKRIIERVREAIVSTFRPIVDRLLHDERGPTGDTKKERVSEEELLSRFGNRPPFDPSGKSDLELALRYAPILYHAIGSEPEADYIRRYDFDGDWKYDNNWKNAVGRGMETTAHVYYDIKETRTHTYLTYAIYHPRRYTANPVPGLKKLGRWENHTGGVIVVVEKGAPYGKEVALIITADGSYVHSYSGRAKAERWKRENGSWGGYVRFIDEPDHPFFDYARTHPQVYVDDKDHSVYGFNGRQDDGGFEKEGVVYYPTGTAEQPESPSDRMVGYALLPLQVLAEKAEAITEPDSWDTPGRPAAHLRGKEGLDDAGFAPWGWADLGEERAREEARDSERGGHTTRTHWKDEEWVNRGDLFFDPAKVLSTYFRTPEGFAKGYTRHDFIGTGGVDLSKFRPEANTGIVEVLGQE